MSDFLRISEIDSRRGSIGLDAKALYAGANVSQATWNRALGGDDTSTGTLKKLTEELVSRELDILAHLIELHPDHAAALLAGRKDVDGPDKPGHDEKEVAA